MPAGEVGTGGIPDWGAARGAFAASALETLLYRSRKEAAGAAAQALARDRGHVCALRLSSSDGAAEARRLEDRRQAGLPPLRRRKPEGAQCGAEEDRAAPAGSAGTGLRPNQCWSADFVSDKLTDGRTIRILTVIDQFTRECVWLEADRSMNGPKVVAALTRPSRNEARATQHDPGQRQ